MINSYFHWLNLRCLVLPKIFTSPTFISRKKCCNQNIKLADSVGYRKKENCAVKSLTHTSIYSPLFVHVTWLFYMKYYTNSLSIGKYKNLNHNLLPTDHHHKSSNQYFALHEHWFQIQTNHPMAAKYGYFVKYN